MLLNEFITEFCFRKTFFLSPQHCSAWNSTIFTSRLLAAPITDGIQVKRESLHQSQASVCGYGLPEMLVSPAWQGQFLAMVQYTSQDTNPVSPPPDRSLARSSSDLWLTCMASFPPFWPLGQLLQALTESGQRGTVILGSPKPLCSECILIYSRCQEQKNRWLWFSGKTLKKQQCMLCYKEIQLLSKHHDSYLDVPRSLMLIGEAF